MLPPVLARLPQLDVVECYFEPDGSFPNHEPNPLLPENRAFIVEKTRSEGADLGVAYDGDADRCFFVDDTGEFVPGDFVTALLAQAMLAEGAGREGDLRRPRELGRAARDRGGGRRTARQPGRPRLHQAPHARGGRPLRGRGLRALLLPRLHAGRHGRRPLPRDARAALTRGKAAVGAPRPLPRALLHHRRDQHPRRGRRAKLREIEERYAAEGGRISHLDGVSVDFDDWHFNVRPSNTEPLLRLNLEALSEPEMEARRDEVLDLIRS